MTARKATRRAAKPAKSAKKKVGGRARTATKPARKPAAAAARKAAKPARKAAPKAAKSARKTAPSAPRRAAKPRQAAGSPVPEGYHSATPYLIVKGGAAAIDFYRKSFGATEIMRIADPSGKLGHAEVKIGDSVIMLADEFPELGIKSPKTLGGTGSSILLYVADVDTVFARTIAAGGRQLRPVTDQFYGDRTGTLEDPFGHQWSIATHTEDVSAEEMNARMAALEKQQAGG